MRYARVRGIPPLRLAFRYLIKNVMVPALTFLRYRLVAFLLTGLLVVGGVSVSPFDWKIPGVERTNIKPQYDEWTFSDGRSVPAARSSPTRQLLSDTQTHAPPWPGKNARRQFLP